VRAKGALFLEARVGQKGACQTGSTHGQQCPPWVSPQRQQVFWERQGARLCPRGGRGVLLFWVLLRVRALEHGIEVQPYHSQGKVLALLGPEGQGAAPCMAMPGMIATQPPCVVSQVHASLAAPPPLHQVMKHCSQLRLVRLT
jgi:hypothetical protein